MQPNYCPFCGSKLVENAKFCSQCGRPVQSASEKDNSNLPRQGSGIEEVSSTESNSQKVDPMHTIKIGKYDLHVAESIIAYNKLRSLFVDNAETCRHTFESFYNSSVTNFETLYDKALPKILELSATAVRFATSTLEKYGLYGVTPEEFLQLARNDLHLEQDLQVYADIATDLVSFAEQLSSYRANNRSGGLQWQGGGFGLSGAIKGTLMAGALSLGTDAIRGIGHAIVNSADRARFKKLQIDLYNARDHKAFLGQKLYDLEQQETPSNEDLKKALNLTLQGMAYDPYFLLSYLNLYKMPFVSKKDLLKLVKLFGMEDSFSKKVAEYEEKPLLDFKSMPEETIEDIDKKIIKAKELESTLCYPNISISALNKKRREIIRNAEKEAAKEEAAKRAAEEAAKKEAEAAQKAYEENLAFRKKHNLDELKRNVDIIDKYIKSGKLEPVWTLQKEHNVYAEYALFRYYIDTYDSIIKAGDISKIDKTIVDVIHRARNNNLYAKYLEAYIHYGTKRSRSIFRDSSNDDEYIRAVCALADQGVLSAIGRRGAIGCSVNRSVIRLPDTPEESLQYLKSAADRGEVVASAYLGAYYRTGKCGLSVDLEKAEYYLSRSAECGQPMAIKELKLLKEYGASTPPGNCFITSAVCQSLGKPDDCYELTTFRAFRDNWLYKQPGGQELIKEYYRVAPQIVKNIDARMDKATIYTNILEHYLRPCLSLIEQGKNKQCRDLYEKMVNHLIAQYI